MSESQSSRSRSREERLYAALLELVECKDLIEAVDADFSSDEPVLTVDQRNEQRAEYKRRKPLAWEQARKALVECVPVTRSETAHSGDSYKEAVEMNLRLRKALEQCVRVCRDWHAMPGKPGPHDAFDIYFNHSPEMKLIRDALGKMPDPTEA